MELHIKSDLKMKQVLHRDLLLHQDTDSVESQLERVVLKKIQSELREYQPDKVVWDIENLSKQPPWGTNISSDITDLSNYFVTSSGDDFITVFFHALEKAGFS